MIWQNNHKKSTSAFCIYFFWVVTNQIDKKKTKKQWLATLLACEDLIWKIVLIRIQRACKQSQGVAARTSCARCEVFVRETHTVIPSLQSPAPPARLPCSRVRTHSWRRWVDRSARPLGSCEAAAGTQRLLLACEREKWHFFFKSVLITGCKIIWVCNLTS